MDHRRVLPKDIDAAPQLAGAHFAQNLAEAAIPSIQSPASRRRPRCSKPHGHAKPRRLLRSDCIQSLKTPTGRYCTHLSKAKDFCLSITPQGSAVAPMAVSVPRSTFALSCAVFMAVPAPDPHSRFPVHGNACARHIYNRVSAARSSFAAASTHSLAWDLLPQYPWSTRAPKPLC
jgi:hypothetical protein